VLHGLLKFDVHKFALYLVKKRQLEINCRDNLYKQMLCQRKSHPKVAFECQD
jgi:hypothetical protein